MPHLSKQRLQKETYVKINRELGKALEKLVRVNKKEAFMYELLTFTERVMLAKRLAIILMLDRDNSYYEIQHTLKVSPSTVARFDEAIGRGKHARLIPSIKKGRAEEILEEIIKLIAIPLTTPYKGVPGIKLNFD